MSRLVFGLILIGILFSAPAAQSNRVKNYSESASSLETNKDDADVRNTASSITAKGANEEVIKVDTDLIFVPTRVSDRKGRLIGGIQQEEFRIYDNGEEQTIDFFTNESQPFTVALLLDMSYSSVFKLSEIQAAALMFIEKIGANDKVMVVAFDEKVRVLCEPTNNKKALRLAIEAARIGSGTSVYNALNLVIGEKFKRLKERKAVILLSDGVDTSSTSGGAREVLKSLEETDVLVYALKYDTFNDVQKNRRKDAQVFFDENDRPYIVERPRSKGEREEDYEKANDFLKNLTDQTGGRVFRVSSVENLKKSFSQIAEELRYIYILGYYPQEERERATKHNIKVRVYRPNLVIKARNGYVLK